MFRYSHSDKQGSDIVTKEEAEKDWAGEGDCWLVIHKTSQELYFCFGCQ